MLKGSKHSEKAKQKNSLAHLREKSPNFGKLSEKKGKTYEEMYGIEKAKKLKEIYRLSFLGEKNPNFNKHCKEETIQKMSLIKLGKISSKKGKTNIVFYGEEKAAKIKEKSKKLRSEESKKNMRKPKSEEGRKNMSLASKKLWQDPLHFKKMMIVFHVSPNKPEIFLSNLLNNVFPNEYKYVGDGEFILAGKCPDFVNVNGQKKIIELFGDYWHGENFTKHSVEQEEKQRIDLFSQYGYSTLIVWEKELANINILKDKILSFSCEGN